MKLTEDEKTIIEATRALGAPAADIARALRKMRRDSRAHLEPPAEEGDIELTDDERDLLDGLREWAGPLPAALAAELRGEVEKAAAEAEAGEPDPEEA